MRQELLARALSLLERHGFRVATFYHTNSCFDLIARSPNLTLLVKVFGNIDALRPEHDTELRKLEKIFNAEALILGEKTKAFSLQRGMVYERHDIPVLNLGSFADLLDERAPYIKYYKGKSIVELDADAMRRKREEAGKPLSEVAEQVGLAKESLHRFEAGASTSLDTARKLEAYFKCTLIKQANFLGETGHEPIPERELFSEHFEDELLQKIHDLGLKLAEFHRAPFDAFTQPSEGLLISLGHKKADIQRKALDLGKSGETLAAHAVILAKEFKARKVEDIPVIGEEDLETLHKAKDLLKLIREREKLR